MSGLQTQTILTSCPRDCYDGCGVQVNTEYGRVVAVTGNADHPGTQGPLCFKCTAAYNGVWLDDKERLTTPLRRVGPKGSKQFEPISWDEALDTVAQRLQNIVATSGARKIAHTHYTGTCSMLANLVPGAFFGALGATEVDPDTVCNKAGHEAWRYVFGDSLNGADPRTAASSNCILVWGANPSVTAPHVDKLWLEGSSAKVIVIDPVRHDTADRADLFLQVRPGSDAALAFSLLHVMQRDGLLDTAFIRDHVLGYSDVEADIQRCTPEWGKGQTDVDAALIEEAARLYASGPSFMWLGQGLQRQPRGGNIFRACAMLPALTGNIGKPGTGAYYLNDVFSIAERGGKSPEYGGDEEGRGHSISQMDLPEVINDSDAIQAYVVWNCNPLASNPDQARLRQGLSRNDLFTVVVDCFATDTAQYADIILPAASFLEFDDLCASYFHVTFGPQVKCQEPLGEALPNQEIFRRLGKLMKLESEELYCPDQDLIDGALEELNLGLNWDELKAKGWVFASEDTMELWSDYKFATLSGKIEIASQQALTDGHPLAPAPDADRRPDVGTFRLLSPADKNLMNSSYGNDKRLQRSMGKALVTMNPADAASLGITTGDQVELSNSGGSLLLQAEVSDKVPAQTLLSTKSRWLETDAAGANINLLHVPEKTDMGESSSVHGMVVEVRKV